MALIYFNGVKVTRRWHVVNALDLTAPERKGSDTWGLKKLELKSSFFFANPPLSLSLSLAQSDEVIQKNVGIFPTLNHVTPIL